MPMSKQTQAQAQALLVVSLFVVLTAPGSALIRGEGRALSGYCFSKSTCKRNGRFPKWYSYWCSCNSGWEGRCCDVPESCSAGSSGLCSQDDLKAKSAKCADVSASGPLIVGKENLPTVMQGVFWLQDQGSSSALISFGQGRDGAGLSKLSSDGAFSIRVSGDRVWSFHDQGSGWRLAEMADLIYHFKFDSSTNPTKAQIIPEARNFAGLKLTATWLLDFEMELVTEKHEKYPDSIVWARTSAVIGQSFEPANYLAVQVMDGEGHKTAAFDEWLAYCNNADKTGSTPGQLWYHEAN